MTGHKDTRQVMHKTGQHSNKTKKIVTRKIRYNISSVTL